MLNLRSEPERPAAIERAFRLGTAEGAIDFRVVSALDYKPQQDGPFDLIVMSETIYYLGWLYTFFEVSWPTTYSSRKA